MTLRRAASTLHDWFDHHHARGGALLVVATVAGCGAPEMQQRDDIASVESAIFNTDFQDASGSILIRVKTCDISPSNFTNCAYCIMDPQWTLVGGGAEIIGENTPGAMIQSSFPIPRAIYSPNQWGCSGPGPLPDPVPPAPDIRDRLVWFTRASGAQHQLRAYAIGMQLRNGPNGAVFAPATPATAQDRVASSVNPPTNFTVDSPESDLDPNYIMIGGGASLFTTDTGDEPWRATNAYLTQSEPINGAQGRAWRASARSQTTPAPDEGMKAFAIGVEACPPNFGGFCLSHPSIRSTIVASGSGYRTSSNTLGPSFVQTSIGGFAGSDGGGGRYLADLIPFNGGSKGFTVRTKANLDNTSGTMSGTGLVTGRTQAAYQANAVLFSSNGRVLSRPTGNDPPLQQSATYPPTTSAQYWHLESYPTPGGSTYRLRNGNPDSGTECAYRPASTNLVRVKACGTGDEFKWTIWAGKISQAFQLRNVQANRCLDNNGQGAVTGDVVLKTCSATSGGQILSLQSFGGWPPL
jgi:hypothetical protein